MSYYKTQIKSVGIGVATDVQGKILRFMGNWYCQAGDIVWTDGKYIFGNSTPKPAPVIGGAPEKGIPVLADDLRGYFNNSAKFKKYSIATDNWIVNNDRNFMHGTDTQSGNNIIDAEISSDTKLLTATGGFYRKSKSLSLNNQVYNKVINRYYDDEPPEKKQYSVAMRVEVAEGSEFILGIDEQYDSDANIEIYKNYRENGVITRTRIDKINLKQYADLAENDALKIQKKIMDKSNKEATAVNYTRQQKPPKDFIASKYAKITTFHLSKNGDWDAVIIASAYGYCFPYMTFDASIFVASFPNGEDKVFSEYLVWCIETFESNVFMLSQLPFQPDIEKYAAFTGIEKDESGNYTQAYKDYILDKVAYYIPLARFKYYQWFTMVYSAVKILKVHNGEVTETIYEDSGGGTAFEDMLVEYKNKRMLQYFAWDEKEFLYDEYDNFVFPTAEEIAAKENEGGNPKWDFPLDEDYYFKAEGLKILSIHKTEDDSKVVEVPNEIQVALYSNFIEDYFIYPTEPMYQIDETAVILSYINNMGELYEGTYLLRPRFHYNHTSVESEEGSDEGAKIVTKKIYDEFPKNDNYKTLSGWFSTSADDDDLCINFCFAKIKKNYLFGIRNGVLMKLKADGEIEQVADNLKNFRLRELKNISKAKK